jgi:hypothetical protein
MKCIAVENNRLISGNAVFQLRVFCLSFLFHFRSGIIKITVNIYWFNCVQNLELK